MFSEVLKIKPVIDGGSAARAERTLVQRFSNVTRKFSGGLKAAVKGSILGFSLGILAKILNPIKDLEEKMQALLGHGKDLAEQADRFGTTPGKLQRIETLGATLGVKPEDLQKLMEHYADAIETARVELLKPVKDRSETTNLLQNFAQEKDIAESFFKFMQTLKTVTDQNERGQIEKDVLGERLFGFKRAFADNPDLKAQLNKIPNEGLINSANQTVTRTAVQVQADEALRGVNDMLTKASLLNAGTPGAINSLETTRLQKENDQFANFNSLAQSAKGIEAAIGLLQKPLNAIQTSIGFLVTFIERLQKTSFFRNVLGGKDK